VARWKEAQERQGDLLSATHESIDAGDRILVSPNAVCRVIGVDTWEMKEAGIAVIVHGTAGGFPHVVLMNQTTSEGHGEHVLLALVPNEAVRATTFFQGLFCEESV
jgi:hypothetical protein